MRDGYIKLFILYININFIIIYNFKMHYYYYLQFNKFLVDSVTSVSNPPMTPANAIGESLTCESNPKGYLLK